MQGWKDLLRDSKHAVQERSKTLQPACRTKSGDKAEQTPREAKGELGEAVPPTPKSSPVPGAAPAPLPSDPPALLAARRAERGVMQFPAWDSSPAAS